MSVGLTIGLLSGCALARIEVLRDVDAGAEHASDSVRTHAAAVSEEHLEGAYRYSDGFWMWEIHLMPKGRYEVFSISDILEEDDRGELRRGIRSAGKGTWTATGSSVTLRSSDTVVHVWTVVDVAGVRALMEPSEAKRTRRVYTRTISTIVDPQRPNQSPEPTATAVTPPAAQESRQP